MISRVAALIVGVIIIALGLLTTYNLSRQQDSRIGPEMFHEPVMYLGPVFLVAGGFLCVRALSTTARLILRRIMLVLGIIMLIVGAFPWAYTPLLIGDGGMEGSGMLGTLIFLFVGLPGLVLTLLALTLRG
jgi:hypothetical protein